MNEQSLDIYSEVLAAVSTRRTGTPGCCIVSNPRLRQLHRHKRDLLPVVEDLSGDDALMQIPPVIFRSNIRELFEMYFRIAFEYNWDFVSFVISLPEHLFSHAVAAIQHVWAINNDLRLTVMPLDLYRFLCRRLQNLAPVLTLKRLVKIGQLSFDRENPGRRSPSRYADRLELE